MPIVNAPSRRPALNSPNLSYRRPVVEDWPALVSYRSNQEFLRFSPEEDFPRQAAERLLASFAEWDAEVPAKRFTWVASLTGSDQVVGICSLRRESADNDWAEIGFELDPRHWGNGLASEMAGALLIAGFRELGLHRIQAHCVGENLRSARVLTRIGMTREGALREKHRFKGRHWDEVWFGILRREWMVHAAPERGPEADGRQ